MKIIQSLFVSWRSSKIRKWYKKEFNILQGLIVSWERNEYVNNYLKKNISSLCFGKSFSHKHRNCLYESIWWSYFHIFMKNLKIMKMVFEKLLSNII